MSINHILLAMKAKVGSSARKLVLIKLADNSNDSGDCFPSYQHIADHCEMSRRSVISHINKLANDGFLIKSERKTPSGNTSNTYRITIESRGANISLGGENSALGGGENFAPRTSHSFEPVNETKERKKSARFEKPTFKELKEFGIEKTLNLDGMFDYYESNGWRVGKNQMKDWRASARGWSRRQGNFGNKSNAKQTAAEANAKSEAVDWHNVSEDEWGR